MYLAWCLCIENIARRSFPTKNHGQCHFYICMLVARDLRPVLIFFCTKQSFFCNQIEFYQLGRIFGLRCTFVPSSLGFYRILI